jgi:carbon storage regulator
MATPLRTHRPDALHRRPGRALVRDDSGAREATMLVLTRKSNQSIMIGNDIEVSVLSIMGEKVRIGIQAPRDIPVFRKEVYLEIQQEESSPSNGRRSDVDAALEQLGESGDK